MSPEIQTGVPVASKKEMCPPKIKYNNLFHSHSFLTMTVKSRTVVWEDELSPGNKFITKSMKGLSFSTNIYGTGDSLILTEERLRMQQNQVGGD